LQRSLRSGSLGAVGGAVVTTGGAVDDRPKAGPSGPGCYVSLARDASVGVGPVVASSHFQVVLTISLARRYLVAAVLNTYL
jgi:hypothetical protein